MSIDKNAILEELRKRAEALVTQASYSVSPTDIQFIHEMAHELAVHQTEIEMQNEELQRAMRELEMTRNRYATLFDHAPVGYVVLDSAGVIRQANATWANMVGQPNEDFRGKPFTAYLVQEDVSIFWSRFRALFRNPKNKHIELRVQQKNAHWLYVNIQAQLLTPDEWQEAHPTHTHELLVIVTDISESTRQQQALHESQQRIQSIFLNAPVGMGVVVNYIIQEVNPRFCEMMGCGQNELLGKSLQMLYPAKDDFIGVCRELDRQVQTYGRGTIETHWTRKDGTVIDVLLSLAPIDPQDLRNGVTFTALDTTRRRQTEKEKQKLQEQLNQIQKLESVGRLAGGVAHDFNNMVGVIIGYADLILERITINHDLYSDVSEIKSAAERAAALTRQLLTFARKQPVVLKRINVNETIGTMLKMLRRLIGENIELTFVAEENLWPVEIDPSQFDQILTNLCINAKDAINGVGKITICTANTVIDEGWLTHHPDIVPGEFVKLSVMDTGCGMNAETLSKIFEPFFTTKPLGVGTGLGLSMVYGAVKQNRGFIEIQSELGYGTSCHIYLPRAYLNVEVPIENSVPSNIKHGNETILLVEDEPSILKATSMMLEREGYMVLSALSPDVALQIAKEHKGDLHMLITDIIMPGKNGIELVKELLQLYPNINYLFMSGYPSDVITRQEILSKSFHFIQKPFSKTEFILKVRTILNDSSSLDNR